jgi:hypothetical protein
MQLFDKPRKKNPANSPHFFFFKLTKNAIWKRHHMQGKIKPDDDNTVKQSVDLLFLSSPTSTCNALSKE